MRKSNQGPEFSMPASLDRVDELVSMLLDDELSDREMRELNALLEGTPEARKRYLGLMQLHTDLVEYYRPPEQAPVKSPVLGFLGEAFNMPGQTSQDPTS